MRAKFIPILIASFTLLAFQPVLAASNPSVLNIADQALNFIYPFYSYLTNAITYLLEQTIFKSSPQLAQTYGDVATFLATLTAIYIILEVFAIAKRIVRVLLALGWVLFAVAIGIRMMPA